jgi:hypothetical protein
LRFSGPFFGQTADFLNPFLLAEAHQFFPGFEGVSIQSRMARIAVVLTTAFTATGASGIAFILPRQPGFFDPGCFF